MPSSRKKRRYESPEAKKGRLWRTLMDCFREDPKYQALIDGALRTSFTADSPAMYRQAVARHVSETLRLNESDGSGAPSWAIDAVMWDIQKLVRSKKRSRPTPRRNENGFLDIELVRGDEPEPRFQYGDSPYFTIEISPSTLRVTFELYDESGEYWGEAEDEENLDFLVDGGVGADQIKELRQRTRSVVDHAIDEIEAELLTRHRDARHTQPSTVEKDKEIATALVGFLLRKSTLMPSGCNGPEARDTVRERLTNVIGIDLPRK